MVTLSPQGRAVAAIVLAFLLVTGSLNRIGVTAVAIFDGTSSKDQFVVATILNLLIAGAVLWFSGRAAAAGTEQWVLGLSQAVAGRRRGARVLAVIGIVITALSLIAALSNDVTDGLYYSF